MLAHWISWWSPIPVKAGPFMQAAWIPHVLRASKPKMPSLYRWLPLQLSVEQSSGQPSRYHTTGPLKIGLAARWKSHTSSTWVHPWIGTGLRSERCASAEKSSRGPHRWPSWLWAAPLFLIHLYRGQHSKVFPGGGAGVLFPPPFFPCGESESAK